MYFEQYVIELLNKNKGRRIYSFQYENKNFWLKQPENIKGIWKFLKPDSYQSFLHEIESLKYLDKSNISVPKIRLSGNDFLVLEDAGVTVSAWTEDPTISIEKKNYILADTAKGLINLHKKQFIHGRPVLRDITWGDGKITFLDLESYSSNCNLKTKVKDTLIFLHSLGRSRFLSKQQIYDTTKVYKQHCDSEVWAEFLKFINQYKWIYYVLLPFKPIARMDLIAIYRLYETIFQLEKEK